MHILEPQDLVGVLGDRRRPGEQEEQHSTEASAQVLMHFV
jgi:hypothetical protein